MELSIHDIVCVSNGAPDLVDIKITDYCPFGCAYCYQGSTTEGVHAKFEDIEKIAKLLGRAGVLEVALGGGEPTLHPDFDKILDVFSKNGIVPSFTTRNLSYVLEDFKKDVIKKYASVGFSIDKLADVKYLINKIKEKKLEYQIRSNNGYTDKRYLASSHLTVQYVMGTMKSEDFIAMMDMLHENGISVLILGYKTTGFGNIYKECVNNNLDAFGTWIETFNSREYNFDDGYMPSKFTVSIDTKFAQDYPDFCEKYFDRSMYYTTEGIFSSYIDAVTMRMKESSSCTLDGTDMNSFIDEELHALPKYIASFKSSKMVK